MGHGNRPQDGEDEGDREGRAGDVILSLSFPASRWGDWLEPLALRLNLEPETPDLLPSLWLGSRKMLNLPQPFMVVQCVP